MVENKEVMCQGLSMLLAGYMDIKIVGESSNDEEVVRIAREFEPDVILMDISMTKMNGIEATRDIHAERAQYPQSSACTWLMLPTRHKPSGKPEQWLI